MTSVLSILTVSLIMNYLLKQCIVFSVAMSQTTDCTSPSYVDVRGGGYLSTLMTQELSVGSQACPWRLYAMPGQRINFTLLDFSSNVQISSGGYTRLHSSDGGPCTMYGYILDGVAAKKRICGVRGHIRQHLYITDDHQADVILQGSDDGRGEFTYGLIQYQGTYI